MALFILILRPCRRQDMPFRIFTWRIHRSSTGSHGSQGKFLSSSHLWIQSRPVRSQVGLLPAGHRQQISSAYKMYARNDDMGWQESTGFKRTFSINVQIEFVGVWYTRVPTCRSLFQSNTLCRDTVCSSGMIPYTLPLMVSNTSLRYFRHALSLDERRARFKANYWHRLKDSNQKGTKIGEMPRSNQRHPHNHSSHDHDHKMSLKENHGPSTTDVREVWFAGCHSGMRNHLRAAFPI